MLHDPLTQVDLGATLGYTMTDTTPELPPSDGSYIVESRYGELVFTPDQVLTVGRSILGFPQLTQFGLSRLPGHDDKSLLLLQSLEDATVSFPCMALDLNNPMIEEADLLAVYEQLEIDPADGATLCIMTAREELGGGSAVSINLRAPVFVDSRRKMAWQIVLSNPHYPIRHSI